MDKFSPTSNREGTELSLLFEAERLPMLRMAALLVGSAAIAEEVVQDAFAAVSERWDVIERPGGYLRTSVVNGCAQVLRRRSAEDRARHYVMTEPTTELPTRLVELRHALDHLNERQRIVVVLRYFVDITDEEIARILDVQPSTVRSLARRAFTVLRKELS